MDRYPAAPYVRPMNDLKTHYRTCPFCEATCGLEIQTEGERVVQVRGDQNDVLSKGFLCTKGLALGDLHHDPDRLRRPLIRRGSVADPRWEEVSWPAAFEYIDENIRRVVAEHGREALGVYFGNPNVHNPSLYFYTGLFGTALRTRNIFSASSVDQLPKQVACALLYGGANSVPLPDIDRTHYWLVLGANPFVSNGSLLTAPDLPGRVRALQARGGRLVVVDPRVSITAKNADEHLFIVPGTDAYFLAALAHTLFDENLANPGAVAEHLAGLDEVRAMVRGFSPEVVSERCGIAAGDIRRIARELSAAPSAAVYGRIGTCTQEFGTLASWLIEIVNILTGNLDRPGGIMFPRPLAAVPNTKPSTGKSKGVTIGRHVSRVRGLPRIFGEMPVSTLADEIETPGPGQLRALFTIAGNPLVSTPNSRRLAAAFESLDFLVSLDIYRTQTARHAHVILPGLSPLEDSHYDWIFAGFTVRNAGHFSPAIFAKNPEQPYEWEIMLTLSSIVSGGGPHCDLEALDRRAMAGWIQALGEPPAGLSTDEIIDRLDGARGPDRILDYLLRAGPYGEGFGRNADGLSLAKVRAAPHGIDLGPMEPRVPEVLRTASGKVELTSAPIVKDWERLRRELNRPRPPFVLVGRRHIKSNNSWMHNIERLAKGADRCALWVHPDDARRLGLATGQTAAVESKVGRVEAGVLVTGEVMRGVVSLPHGWGQGADTGLRVAAKFAGVNTNILSDESAVDELSGNAVLDGIPVTVAPR